MVPVIDTAATGANIKVKMNAAGKTVKDVQNACGFTSGNAVYKWINGICMPTLDNMVIIADICGVTLNDMVIIQKR